jgi:hypothetical protein
MSWFKRIKAKRCLGDVDNTCPKFISGEEQNLALTSCDCGSSVETLEEISIAKVIMVIVLALTGLAGAGVLFNNLLLKKPTPIPTPSATPIPTPSVTPIPTPSVTPTPTPSVTPIPTYIPTPEPTPTYIPTPEPTPTYIPTPEPTPTYIPTPEPPPEKCENPKICN